MLRCTIPVDVNIVTLSRYGPYYSTLSNDSGLTWSVAAPMKDTDGNYIGCARLVTTLGPLSTHFVILCYLGIRL